MMILLASIPVSQDCKEWYSSELATGNETGEHLVRNIRIIMSFEQGIYTSSGPVIPKPPVVRMGLCGTPLLRLGNTKNDSIRADGDILGFFLSLDESSYKGRMLFSCAQPCDPLVEAGWRIADSDYTGDVEPLVNEVEGAEVES